MKLFLAFIIAGFFMAADAHLYKKCFAPVYCLSSDSTESKNVTTTWAQVYPSLIEASPDNCGCCITSNSISAKAEQQIKTCEEKLNSLDVKLNETTQNCKDVLQRQLNVTEQRLQTIEIEIEKSNQLNENLTLAIKEKEDMNKSLVQTQGKLDEEIDKSKQLYESLMLAIKEKEGLNGSLVQTKEKLDEEINKSKQLNESLMLAIKEKEGLNESLVKIKEELGGFCPIFYNDKCFFFDMRKKVLIKEAKKRCNCSGGILGNIYDETHLNETMSYVRENYMTENSFVNIWLGMTYKNDKVYLSNETGAKYWKWSRGSPLKGGGYILMFLEVLASTTNEDQYMRNFHSVFNPTAYPFCEL